MELNFITLEDNKSYGVFSTMELEDNKYLLLASDDNPKDVTIRKVIAKDDKEYLVKLDNEEEFEKIMEEFTKKYRTEDKNEE